MLLFQIVLIIGIVLLSGALFGLTDYWSVMWAYKRLDLPIEVPPLSTLLVINPLKNTAIMLAFMLLIQWLIYNSLRYLISPYPLALLLLTAVIVIVGSVVKGGVEYILLQRKLKD